MVNIADLDYSAITNSGVRQVLQLGIIGVIRTNNSKMRDFRSIRSNNPKHTIAIDLTIKTKEPNKT